MRNIILKAGLPATGEPPPGSRRGRGRPVQARCLPIQPLLAVAGVTGRRLQLAVRASGTTVAQAAVRGLTVDQAYSWCDRLGLYPSEVWGAVWWEVAA